MSVKLLRNHISHAMYGQDDGEDGPTVHRSNCPQALHQANETQICRPGHRRPHKLHNANQSANQAYALLVTETAEPSIFF